MLKTENQFKIHQVVSTTDGTPVFIKAPIPKSLHDYYWQKQRYSIGTQVAVGCNLHFIDIATGLPRYMHDARMLNIYDARMLTHTALYQRANNNGILLESKVN